jgi:prepilin-type processing-associated H-X9-DG protein
MNTDRLAKVRGGQGGARAFTLIELLVIFALMAMMLLMMGPAFVTVRDKARELQCLNNTRNLAIAHTIYSIEHNDQLVPHAVWRPPHNGALVPTVNMTFWPDLLQTYVGDDRIFRCPCMHCDSERGIGYGMNLQVAGAFLVQSETYATHLTEIQHPSQTVLFADAAFVTRATMNRPLREWQEDASRPWGCWTLRTPSDSLWHFAPARLMPRHHGRANAAFVDGHAETLTPVQLGYGLPLGHPKNWWDRH